MGYSFDVECSNLSIYEVFSVFPALLRGFWELFTVRKTNIGGRNMRFSLKSPRSRHEVIGRCRKILEFDPVNLNVSIFDVPAT